MKKVLVLSGVFVFLFVSIPFALAQSGLPGPPTNVTAIAGRNRRATVSFTAPSLTGGRIRHYTVTSSPGGITASGDSPLDIYGLSNGTAYTFTVTATNAIGTGPASTPSNPVIPGIAPGAPKNAKAVAVIPPGQTSQALVTFDPPLNAAECPPITGYNVTCCSNSTTYSGAESPITVASPGVWEDFCQGCTCTVTATNEVGNGPASKPSNLVTFGMAPEAPTNVTATRSNGSAQVSFSYTGEQYPVVLTCPITKYTVKSSPGGKTVSIIQPGAGAAGDYTFTITIPGLSNGAAYTFTVTATNAIGAGPASTPSNPVIPAAVPGPPTNITATPGDSSAAVSFKAPSNSPGDPITKYTVTSSPGGIIASGAQSPITVTGLTNCTGYTFTVTATNATGTSISSAPSKSICPGLLPDAPMNVAATAVGYAAAKVSFSAPSNGSCPNYNYLVRANPADWTASGQSSPITVTGLPLDCIAYTFTVTAYNAVGKTQSRPSNTLSPTQLCLPSDACHVASMSCPYPGCTVADIRTTLNILPGLQRLELTHQDGCVDLYLDQTCGPPWAGYWVQGKEPQKNYCGPTAGRNLLNWYGQDLSYSQLGSEMKTNSWMSGLDVAEDCVEICLLDAVCFGICANLLDSGLLDLGTLSADLEKTLEKHSPAGYRVYMHKENPGPAAFEALLTQGNPIVVLIWNGKTLHWTLVTGTYDLNGSTWLRFANNEDLSWDTFVHQWSFAGWNWPVPDIVSSVGIVPYTWMYYQKTTELTSDLLCGNSITSYDGRFTLILQTDGNLVLYWNEPGHPALWSSHTQGKAGYDAEMQEDGNFVIYDAARNALWASGTDGHPGAYLVLQNDGNLVIYDTNDAAIWSSNTCCH